MMANFRRLLARLAVSVASLLVLGAFGASAALAGPMAVPPSDGTSSSQWWALAVFVGVSAAFLAYALIVERPVKAIEREASVVSLTGDSVSDTESDRKAA